jgi:hypothetical protein
MFTTVNNNTYCCLTWGCWIPPSRKFPLCFLTAFPRQDALYKCHKMRTHRNASTTLNLRWRQVATKFSFLWRCDPTRVMAYSFLRFLDHTQRRTIIGRTPLDEWSARRRDLYLTTHNTHNKQTSMTPVGFESTISADEWPQSYALDSAATGIGTKYVLLQLKSDDLLITCKRKWLWETFILLSISGTDMYMLGPYGFIYALYRHSVTRYQITLRSD